LKEKIMGLEATKLELIEWLTKLDDEEFIKTLKIVKDSRSTEHDWWDGLSSEEKKGLERGMNDIKEGRTIPHEQVAKKYGL
jgi:hypothetical protein